MTRPDIEAIWKRWDKAMDQISMDTDLHELNWLVSQDYPALLDYIERLEGIAKEAAEYLATACEILGDDPEVMACITKIIQLEADNETV